jgi:Domain of unknown function (DUF1707)/Domain of unknown function (DUF4190)
MGLPAPGMRPYGYGHMRSCLADRERAVELLKVAFAEGRLDQDELVARVGDAYRSRTYAELAALTADLPAAHGTASPYPGLPGAGSRPAASQRADGAANRADEGARPRPAACGAARELSGLAIAAVILGVGGFITWGITSPFAVILGIAAVPRLTRANETGGAAALLGIVCGLVGTLLILLPKLLDGLMLPH